VTQDSRAYTRSRVLLRFFGWTRGEKGPELVITDPRLGELAADESFDLELLELLVPPDMRSKLPNGGWRKVSLRILIAQLRCEAVRIAEES
jgi:hypothetical protein